MLCTYNTDKLNMDSDPFGEFGETAVQQQQYGQMHFQTQDNAPDDQFQFSQPPKYASMETIQQNSYSVYAPDNEAIQRAQQEQMKVQERLRQRANREYEEKQKRKQQGKNQLEQFLARKQKQTINRRQQNKQKEKRLLERNAKLSEQAGWKKVAVNVPLKQGQHKGQKDITRMRQSIINKKNDQTN